MVLEDLHASDASSLLLLRFVAEEILDMRLVLVATYRDAELISGHPLTVALAELNRVQGAVRAAVEKDPGKLRFTHVLIREVLYDNLLPADHMRAHRQVDEALEACYAGDPEPHVAELPPLLLGRTVRGRRQGRGLCDRRRQTCREPACV